MPPREIITLDPADGDKICDVGSGGGFPALPISAALPSLHVTAIDSTAKKCRYIEETAAQAGICNIDVRCARVEDAKELFESFDFVTARAVASLPVLCELCAPLVKIGGYFLAMKGEKADEEIAEANNAANILGLEFVRSTEYSLPYGGDHRTIAVYKKISSTPKEYPREYRLITKKPL